MTTAAFQGNTIEPAQPKWARYPLYQATGIDWFPELPNHWSVSRLKYLAAIRAGENITALMFEDDGEYPVYGGNGIRGYTSRFSHDGKYVLIGRQGALCGNVHRVRGKFWASEHAAVATCSAGVSVDWFAYLVETMNLKRNSETAAQPGLALERVARLPVPVPEADEQRRIAAFLDRETARIDELIGISFPSPHEQHKIVNGIRTIRERDLSIISAVEHATALLREYRSGLITAAVTGQIDVRQYGKEAT